MLVLPLALLALSMVSTPRPAPLIHSVTDIGHEFTFYFDGRFARQYLPGGVDERNWGTLARCDLTGANLLVLSSGGTPCPYTPDDIAKVRGFLEVGGGVVVLGDYARFRQETGYRLNELARAFGAEFADVAASGTPVADPGLHARDVVLRAGKTLRLDEPARWKVLLRDGAGHPLLARRPVGKGQLLLAARGLAGQKPDASDPINAEWWTPLLQDLAKGKPADPAQRPRTSWAEHAEERDGITLEYTDYTKPYAEDVFAMYRKIRPLQEKLLGVPPAKGTLARFLLLPTDGGGFSSGDRIGIAVWWGGFPEKQYGMAELIGHEATHSWVLPFAEPMWNEGLATYVGILLGRELGLEADADASLNQWLEGARKLDPKFDALDLLDEKAPHVVQMAKPMWIWEQLRKECPDILARYFRAKRRLADPARIQRYTADDCVAVLSAAIGRDLFPWFRSLGVNVEAQRASIGGVARKER
ncbi:MAG: hypothetical protein M9921_12895 [Fimbriimonadaceae bacterium]|nr:hypothetical protein [Fimbriimonadaceae bacterium]